MNKIQRGANGVPSIKRVPEIFGVIGINLGVVGIRARYVVLDGQCEIQVLYWLRLKLHFKTITISGSLDWVGCEEGIGFSG